IRKDNFILIHIRFEHDIMKTMYVLPSIETKDAITDDQVQLSSPSIETFGSDTIIVYQSPIFKPVLSQQNIYARFYEIKNVDEHRPKNKLWNYVLIKDLDKLAKPKLIYTFIESFFT